MKALSIRQPYAWLIANGLKRVENRTWGVNAVDEWIAIHAASSTGDVRREASWRDRSGRLIVPVKRRPPPEDVRFGAVVAVAHLVGCFDVDHWRVRRDRCADGPICWLFDRVVRVPQERSIALSGKLGLWELSAYMANVCNEQIAIVR